MYTATERRELKRFCTAADLKSHQLMHSDVCSCYSYVVNISNVILSRYARYRDVLIICDAMSFCSHFVKKEEFRSCTSHCSALHSLYI